MKHSKLRSYQVLIALCGAGLISTQLFMGQALATSSTTSSNNQAASSSTANSNANANSNAGNAGTTGSNANTNNGAANQNSQRTQSNQSAQSAAAQRAQAAAQKAQKEAKNAADAAKKLDDLNGQKAASDANLKISTSSSGQNNGSASGSGSELIGVSGTASKEPIRLMWGSNTPGYWFTSIWFPIGVAAAASVLIIALASSAVLRSRYKHQALLEDMNLEMTGQYVAPLVPELSGRYEDNSSLENTAQSLVNSVESLAPVAPTEDTSVYIKALAESDAKTNGVLEHRPSPAHSANFPVQTVENSLSDPHSVNQGQVMGTFPNIDPGDTFIDRMRFKFDR